jgi:hypothetical protein
MSRVKKFLKPLLYIVAVAAVVIQFIRPTQNVSSGPTGKGISTQFPVPAEVDQILRRSCYDCHSNTTVYPWYANVQPVGWWLNGHINNGKNDLNFDEFAAYRAFRKYRRFHDVDELVSNNEMPLPSYLLMHRDAALSPEQKTTLIVWANAMRDTMKAHFPADSLERRRGGQRQPSP